MKHKTRAGFGLSIACLAAASVATMPFTQPVDPTGHSALVRIGSGGSGSGTIIGKDFRDSQYWVSVITAAHVTSTSSGARLGLGNGGSPNDYVTGAANVFEHSTYDIAVANFALPQSIWTSINPLGMVAADTTADDGRMFSLVAYGTTGRLRADGMGYDNIGGYGTLRYANNKFENVSNAAMWWENTNPTGAGAVQGEGASAPGDSGGAYLVGGWNGTIFTSGVIGVHGWGEHQSGSKLWGHDSGGVALTQNVIDWVNLNAVPEPGTFLVLGLGLAVLVRRRRKD